jgi:hypothetical protein
MTAVLLAIIGVAVLPFVGLDALIRMQSKANCEVAKNEGRQIRSCLAGNGD